MTRLVAAAEIIVLTLLLHAAGGAPPARAADVLVRVASGLPGGTYRNVYAQNMEREMRGWNFVYVESPGSGRNLDMLADGKADLAFAQADVYAARMVADPSRYEQLMVLGRLGEECLFIAHRKDEPVAQLSQLAGSEGRPTKIAVGDPASGMAGTWSYLVTLDPSLKKAQVDHTSGTLSVNQLAVGVFDAVGWVTDPNNADHKLLQAVHRNDALTLMSISDPFLVAPLENGTRIYEARKIKAGGGLIKDEIDTLCTSAMVFTRKDAPERLINKVSDVVSLRRKEIVKER